MAAKINMSIELDNGELITVTADQRDIAEAEEAGYNGQGRRTNWVRFMAFAAAVRTGKYSKTWDDFRKEVVEVNEAVEESAGGADGLDPGRTAPSEV